MQTTNDYFTSLAVEIGAKIFQYIAVIDILVVSRTSRRVNFFALDSLSLMRDRLCIPTSSMYNDYDISPRALFKKASEKCLKARELSDFVTFQPIVFEVVPMSKRECEYRESTGYFEDLSLNDLVAWHGTQSLQELNLNYDINSDVPESINKETRGCLWTDPRLERPETIFPNLKSLYVVCGHMESARLLEHLGKWKHVGKIHLKLRVFNRFIFPIINPNLSNLDEVVLAFTDEVKETDGTIARRPLRKLLKNLPRSVRRFRLAWESSGEEKDNPIFREAEQVLFDRFPRLRFYTEYHSSNSGLHLPSDALCMCEEKDMRKSTHLDQLNFTM